MHVETSKVIFFLAGSWQWGLIVFFSFQGWGRGNDTVEALRKMGEKKPKQASGVARRYYSILWKRDNIISSLLLSLRAAGARGKGCVSQQWLTGSQEQQGEQSQERLSGLGNQDSLQEVACYFCFANSPKSECFGRVRQRLGSQGSRDNVWRGKTNLWRRVKVPFSSPDNTPA